MEDPRDIALEGSSTKTVVYTITMPAIYTVELDIPWDADPDDYEDDALDMIDGEEYDIGDDPISIKYEDGSIL